MAWADWILPVAFIAAGAWCLRFRAWPAALAWLEAETYVEPLPHETLTIDAEPTVPFDVGFTIVEVQPTPEPVRDVVHSAGCSCDGEEFHFKCLSCFRWVAPCYRTSSSMCCDCSALKGAA